MCERETVYEKVIHTAYNFLFHPPPQNENIEESLIKIQETNFQTHLVIRSQHTHTHTPQDYFTIRNLGNKF